MHTLSRQVRFSLNPFLEVDDEGANAFASRPCGEGLSLYFSLWVEVKGPLSSDTGFVVNVIEIDRLVRTCAVPLFLKTIRINYSKKRHISLSILSCLLSDVWKSLQEKLESISLVKLMLELNPFRWISIDSENPDMFYFSEKFEFAAMHKLWNDDFSEEQNFDVFGKCANKSGHGHNYVLEVVLKSDNQNTFSIGEFETIVDQSFIDKVDHKNLNEDVAFFRQNIPTVENLAVFAWECLNDQFSNTILDHVNVWETDKTYCSYYGT